MQNQYSKVMIEMESSQMMDGDVSKIELMTEGRYISEKDRYVIEYNDSEATGFEDSVTSIEILNDTMALINRTGKSSSNLVVEYGKKHHCHYETPYGDMMIGVFAHAVDCKLDDNGGSIYMKYTIDINSSYVYDNEIKLKIKLI